MGILWGAISAAAYGLIPLFTLPLLEKGIPVGATLVYRFAIAFIAMLPLVLSSGNRIIVTCKEFGSLAILSGFYIFAVVAFFHSFEFLPSSIAATIQFLYPVMVMLIMVIFFGEKFNWLVVISVILGFAGVVFLSFASMPVAELDTAEKINHGLMIGVMLSLLAGLGNSLYMVSLQVAKLPGLSGFVITFYVMFFGALYTFIYAAASGSLEWIASLQELVIAVLLALVTAVFSNLALVWSIQRTGSTLAAILGVMEPLTAVCVGVTVFNEAFTTALAAGIMFILYSVIIAIFTPHSGRIKP